MSDARANRIDHAVSAAGQLIGTLQQCGPVTPAQARLIVESTVRAVVPSFQEFEIRASAERIAGELEREEIQRTKGEGGQLGLPLEGMGKNENQSSDVR